MYMINATFKVISTDRINVLSTLNYLEGQIITFRKCIKANLSYVIFQSIQTERKWMNKCCKVFCLGTSGLSLTFSLEHCNSQATGFSQIWQLQGSISLFQNLTRHHLFLSFILQFPVSVSGFTKTETTVSFQKYFWIEVKTQSFAFQWSSFQPKI